MKMEGSRRRRGDPYGSQTTVIVCCRAAGETVTATPTAGVSEPSSRWGVRALTGCALEKSIRFNKGLLGTTHKLCLGIGLRSRHSLDVRRVGRPQSPDVR